MTEIDLRTEEHDTFVAATDTGLRDILFASFAAVFAVAPLLSVTLGDFWSSALFLPVVGGTYLLTRYIRLRYVEPRIGYAHWGEYRMTRLRKIGLAMLIANLVALALGSGAYYLAGEGFSAFWVFPLPFAFMVLALFSLYAYSVSVWRFFLYGIMIAVGVPVGEWLFHQGIASHHGIPVVFGVAALVMTLAGLVRLFRILSLRPLGRDELGEGSRP